MDSLPLADVPRPLLARLRSLPGTRVAVYVILEEDEYESKFGDGRFLYPRAAFWGETAARAAMARMQSEDAARRKEADVLGSLYRMKTVEIVREEAHNRLVTAVQPDPIEHYSLADLLKLLAQD
jgi:hypothetical protein